MKKYIDDLSLWIGIISGAASLIAFISGETPLTLVLSILFISFIFFVAAFLLHNAEKKKYPSIIDGIHINALDLLDTTYEANSHLKLEEAVIEVTIDNANCHYMYHYKGIVNEELIDDKQGLFFNTANEKNDTENKNRFYGYDLNDINNTQPISLYEVTPPGMSKKLFFPFQTTLSKKDKFEVKIYGDVFDIFPLKGTTYYFIRFSFDNNAFNSYKVKYQYTMNFKQRPKWVNKNIISANKELKKCGRMNISFNRNAKSHYCTEIDDKANLSDIRVYTFHR